MSKPMPKFTSEKAEAEFWDAHDSTEFLDELQEDGETIFVRPENGVVELSGATWRALIRLAKRQRTTPARLVDRWLKEKLSEAS